MTEVFDVEEDMAVEAVGSPTEIAEDSDGPGEIKSEKRKRENRRRDDEAHGTLPEDDPDLDSPGKKPLLGVDQPVSGRELRELLSLHARELREAWGTVESRIHKVEENQRKQNGEIASIAGRTKVNEKDIKQLKQVSEVTGTKVDALAEDVRNLKMHFETASICTPRLPADKQGGPPPDPWAEFLRRKPPLRGEARNSAFLPDVTAGSGQPGQPDQGDTLSDEDRRTLVLGGWLQDARKAVIESECQAILQRDDIKSLVDQEKISVFGPRRSVGMLRFQQRPGEESYSQVRERMWKVVRAISALKHTLESARSQGDDRVMWAAFVKTKAARLRTAHISMVRRVVINLASDTKDDGGGVLNVDHTMTTAYDMDWNAGTIWCGIHKLASATHRAPKPAEVILMPGGWVNLDAVGLIAGCTVDVAKAAFELEL
eukprot:s2862_g5.t1